MTEQHTKPLPRVTPDNAPFWEACRRHELALPWCEACEKPYLPAGPVCPFCFSDRLAWRTASGLGAVSTFTVVHQGWFPAFRDDLPYNVVQVELLEGPRLTANLVDCAPNELRVGLPVEAVFDDLENFTMLRFRPRR